MHQEPSQSKKGHKEQYSDNDSSDCPDRDLGFGGPGDFTSGCWCGGFGGPGDFTNGCRCGGFVGRRRVGHGLARSRGVRHAKYRIEPVGRVSDPKMIMVCEINSR
jgi:hypothetical protein